MSLYRALLVVGGACTLAYPICAIVIVGPGHPDLLLDSLVLSPAFCLAGALAFWKQPRQRAVQRLLAIGALLAFSHTLGCLLTLALRDGQQPWYWLVNLLSTLATGLGFASWTALFAVFPNGDYERAYERVITKATMLVAGGLALLPFIAQPTQDLTVELVTPAPHMASPFFVPALAPLADAEGLIFLCPVIALALFVLRYRRAPAARRVQMRWPLCAAVLVGAAFLAQPLLGPYAPGWIGDLLFVVAVSSLPATLVIGMLRQRLFDVDVLLRRSLIYGLLWLAIAVAYAAIAALLGLAAGQRFSVQIAVFVTIFASMVFQPARRALERFADRLVFGTKLSGYDLIRRFGSTLEAAVALEDLIPTVEATVRAGMGARWVRVALPVEAVEAVEADDRRCPATIGDTTGDEPPDEPPEVVIPITYRREATGTLECGPKREGTYSDADRLLLETLARQTALAIRTVRLTADLQARLRDLDRQAHELVRSRTRLVQAQEAERRRIERDIHDGIQQQMVALMAKVELARARLQSDPAHAEVALAEVQEMVRQAHAALREFARGIHPAVLGDRGLEEAIQACVARLPIGVSIEVDPAIRGARFAPEVEGAAYFLISEGLTNMMKHAMADQAAVRLRASAGCLHIEITDNGRGFDPSATRVSGLRGLCDRMEALGGSLRVVAAPQQGTQLIGMLPIVEEANG